VIGPRATFNPHVTIRERSRIGSRVIIHSGAVIGADGFGSKWSMGAHKNFSKLGIVQIDDDVEIGANTTVDRARFGRTLDPASVKIDNLVQIAHNVVIGRNTSSQRRPECRQRARSPARPNWRSSWCHWAFGNW